MDKSTRRVSREIERIHRNREGRIGDNLEWKEIVRRKPPSEIVVFVIRRQSGWGDRYSHKEWT